MHYTHLFSWVIWRLSRARVVFYSCIGHSPASCTCAVKGLVTFRDRYRDDLGGTRYVITVHYLIRHNLACYKKSSSHEYLSIAISGDLRFFLCKHLDQMFHLLQKFICLTLMQHEKKINFFKDLKIESNYFRHTFWRTVYTSITI